MKGNSPFDRSELKQLIREVLAEMLLGEVNTPGEWRDLKDAWKQLGYPSYQALYKDVAPKMGLNQSRLCVR